MTRGDSAPILPGSTLGLMGGGQLGRMTALAARALGYRVHALDPDPSCPARGVCDRFVCGALDDPAVAADLAEGVDVVTCEREDIGSASLEVLERQTLLRPGRSALSLVQDRGEQKAWLEREGFPLGPHARVSSLAEVRRATQELGPSTRFKRRRGGFDGRAQWSAAGLSSEQLWQAAGGAGLVAEQELDLAAELSVLVARSGAGETAVYPVAYNVHERGALEMSALPAPLPDSLTSEAEALARALATRLDLVGLLAVEMFHTRAGELLVNELAPRPHNTFHSTEWACPTSQFEQLVRAVCNLPLGDVGVRTPTAIANLYGDLWLQGRQALLVELLAAPGLHLRLYDKEPRPRRKLGHLAVTASTPEGALERVESIQRRLRHREVHTARQLDQSQEAP